MKKIQFTLEIKASVAKVFDYMLGLSDKSTYEQWTALFNPTSTYEGSWNKGSKSHEKFLNFWLKQKFDSLLHIHSLFSGYSLIFS